MLEALTAARFWTWNCEGEVSGTLFAIFNNGGKVMEIIENLEPSHQGASELTVEPWTSRFLGK